MKEFGIYFVFLLPVLSYGQQNCKKGDSLFAINEYRYAVIEYTKGINAGIDCDDVYCKRGLAKASLGDNRGAIDDFNFYLESVKGKEDPKEDPFRVFYVMVAYFSRGNCYLILGDKELACRNFSKSGELGYKEAYEMIRKYCD